MKRLLHIIALILVIALAVGAAHISGLLPADNRAFVEKKYSGWNGVLRAWVVSNWSCAGSFNSWLNRCAGEFEKAHNGVYVEFTSVTVQALREMGSSGLRPPELVFFSPGILNDSSLLEYWEPVCMGGYIWVYNTALTDGAPDIPVHLPDDAGRCFSLASIGLLGGGSAGEIEIEEPGIDLGLPAVSQNTEISLDSFINGELPALVISQKELAQLSSLRDAGRGPDWACAVTGQYALADQLLIGGVVLQNDENAAQRTPLARDFLSFLLEEESQQALSSIGAFPVTNAIAYTDFSAYAPMEQLLKSREQIMPDFFSEYPQPGAAAIVRKYLEGRISGGEAMRLATGAGLYENTAYINR
ncbi:MAG: hypothetical protein IJ466_10445 [Clostridia bacterium]|nr:hypothetical protein [Clostridia bacterium]